ncbi:MAG: hypothetical protein ABR549_15680 [Mycobacteriales bacterium]
MIDHNGDDALRARLADIDPMAGRPVAPLTDDHKERAMTSPSPSRRTPLLLAGAAAAVVVAAGGAAFALSGDDGKDKPPATAAKKTVLALTAPPPNIMGLCIQTSPETLRLAAHAFEGKVTSVEGGTVSFDVTHWYKGGTEQVVTVSNQDANMVEDSTTFEAGKTYLVAATETEVGPCSGSGEENAELKAMFEQAFG